MKNIFEIMKEYGLEVPEDKRKEFEKSVLENYKTVTDYENQSEKLAKANETLKANDEAMKDLQGKLDEFKDADVSGLNQRIKELEDSKKAIESDYEEKLANRDFNDALKENIIAANGKNVKAITALLDLEALKESKNQKEDIAEALKKLAEAEDSKMLFGKPEPDVVRTGNLIGAVHGNNVDAEDAKMRAVMGLPQLATNKEQK